MKNCIVVVMASVFFFIIGASAAEMPAQDKAEATAAGATKPGPAASGQPSPNSQAAAFSSIPFWVTIGLVTLFLTVGFSSLRKGLKDWNLKDALSEEAAMPANTPADKLLDDKGRPVMVASSSRLISFMGALVLVAILMGSGYYMIWAYFSGGPIPDLKNITDFLLAGAGIFIPYAVNKVGGAISGK